MQKRSGRRVAVPGLLLAAGLVLLTAALGHMNGRTGRTTRNFLHTPTGSVRSESAPTTDRAPRVGQPVPVATLSGQMGWHALYYSGIDAYDFIARAGKEALVGDGSAAYCIAQFVMRCFGREKEPWNTANHEDGFDAKWAKYPNELYAIESDRALMHACLHYLRADAFASLPARDGGYRDWRLWMHLAYEAHYPPAIAFQLITAPSLPVNLRGPEADAQRMKMQDDVRKVLDSGDPEAIFALGLVFDRPAHQTMPSQGVVLRLAACQLGYDCTSTNPDLEPFFGCAGLGTCPYVSSFEDVLRRGMSEQSFAEAYARAQDVAAAVERGDAMLLETYTRVGR